MPKSGLTDEYTAPNDAVARNTMSASGPLGSIVATRSPTPTPSAASARWHAATSARSSPCVMVSSAASSPMKTRAVSPGCGPPAATGRR